MGTSGPIIQGEEYTSPLYLGGTKKEFNDRGNLISVALYYDGGQKTVTLQGSKISQTLYIKTISGTYAKYPNDAYASGNSKTYYLRGDEYTSPLYDGAGASVEVWERGELCPTELHYAGTKRAVLKPATFNATTAVLAYSK